MAAENVGRCFSPLFYFPEFFKFSGINRVGKFTLN